MSLNHQYSISSISANPFYDISSQTEINEQQKKNSQKYSVSSNFKTARTELNAIYADQYSDFNTPKNSSQANGDTILLNSNNNDSQHPIRCESPLILPQNTNFTYKMQNSSIKKFNPTKSIYVNNPAEKCNQPLQMICPVCSEQIITVVTYMETQKTKNYSYVLALCCMCWVPYQCDQYFQTAIHICYKCGNEIARVDSCL